MPQAFLESGVRRRSLHLSSPPHKAGEPLFNAAGCPQCGSSDGVRWERAWNYVFSRWENRKTLYCANCGLSGIRPHFAGVKEQP